MIRTTQLLRLSLLAALCLGCATKPPVAAPLPEARVEAGPPIILDQNRQLIPLSLTLRNPSALPCRLDRIELSCSVQGQDLPLRSERPILAVGAGGEGSVALDLPLDLRDLPEGLGGAKGQAASWTIKARLFVEAEGRPALELTTSVSGSLALLREPVFRITSIQIMRDLLVTTDLRLGLEIENPNSFPVSLESLSWRLWGEGKPWAGDRTEGSKGWPLTIAAGEKAERWLEFDLNFADSDRKLFDLVANLRTVRYRLMGEALISTGIPGLPSFVTSFDRSGSCAVER